MARRITRVSSLTARNVVGPARKVSRGDAIRRYNQKSLRGRLNGAATAAGLSTVPSPTTYSTDFIAGEVYGSWKEVADNGVTPVSAPVTIDIDHAALDATDDYPGTCTSVSLQAQTGIPGRTFKPYAGADFPTISVNMAARNFENVEFITLPQDPADDGLGWFASGTSTLETKNGFLRGTKNSGTFIRLSKTATFNGADADKIQVVFRSDVVTDTVNMRFSTAAHGNISSAAQAVTTPGEWEVMTFDMSGVTDWAACAVQHVRIQANSGSDAECQFDFASVIVYDVAAPTLTLVATTDADDEILIPVTTFATSDSTASTFDTVIFRADLSSEYLASTIEALEIRYEGAVSAYNTIKVSSVRVSKYPY